MHFREKRIALHTIAPLVKYFALQMSCPNSRCHALPIAWPFVQAHYKFVVEAKCEWGRYRRNPYATPRSSVVVQGQLAHATYAVLLYRNIAAHLDFLLNFHFSWTSLSPPCGTLTHILWEIKCMGNTSVPRLKLDVLCVYRINMYTLHRQTSRRSLGIFYSMRAFSKESNIPKLHGSFSETSLCQVSFENTETKYNGGDLVTVMVGLEYASALQYCIFPFEIVLSRLDTCEEKIVVWNTNDTTTAGNEYDQARMKCNTENGGVMRKLSVLGATN